MARLTQVQRDKLEEGIVKILSVNYPLNTSQVCRIYNGANSRYDIKFCTSGTKDKWKDESNFQRYKHNFYPNCISCEMPYKKIYYYLTKLERQEIAESRIEWRSDPIVRGRKDRMRMWAMKGNLPRLTHFT